MKREVNLRELQLLELKEYEYCLRCGRKLKNPEARLKGFGVVCEKKVKHGKFKKLF